MSGFMGLNDIHAWIIIGFILVTLEMVTAGFFMLCFSLGCFAAAIVAYLGAGFTVQLVVFVISSFITVISLKNVYKNFLLPKDGGTKSNVDRLIGLKGLVTEDINNIKSQGRVKVESEEWKALGTTEETIPKDTIIKVDKIEGSKLYVSIFKEEEKPLVTKAEN